MTDVIGRLIQQEVDKEVAIKLDKEISKKVDKEVKEERIKNAKNLLDILNIETIAKKFKLSKEEIEELQGQQNHE